MLRRKQCTFIEPGAKHYEFGQYNQHFCSDSLKWPAAVLKALQHARAASETPSLYNGVHVNLYTDGGVGVEPHSDKEDSMVQGKEIYSYTLLEDPSCPRPFSVYNRDKTKILDVALGHGDMLVMRGLMQQLYLHGVEKVRPYTAYKSRINLTVRAFEGFTN